MDFGGVGKRLLKERIRNEVVREFRAGKGGCSCRVAGYLKRKGEKMYNVIRKIN